MIKPIMIAVAGVLFLSPLAASAGEVYDICKAKVDTGDKPPELTKEQAYASCACMDKASAGDAKLQAEANTATKMTADERAKMPKSDAFKAKIDPCWKAS